MIAHNRDLMLWSSILAGPIFWLISFEAKLAWIPRACTSQTKLGLIAFSLLAALLTAAAGFVARHHWKQLGNAPPDEAGTPLSRSRLMALGGIVFSIGFCMVIVAQVIPDLVFEVCQ